MSPDDSLTKALFTHLTAKKHVGLRDVCSVFLWRVGHYRLFLKAKSQNKKESKKHDEREVRWWGRERGVKLGTEINIKDTKGLLVRSVRESHNYNAYRVSPEKFSVLFHCEADCALEAGRENHTHEETGKVGRDVVVEVEVTKGGLE